MILTELKETVYSFERQGMNTIRLRVFVNPSDDKVSGHCSRRKWLLWLCVLKDGNVMIDFHYSDSWADPGKQFKPAAWENHSFQNY
jgi:arabinogalactan endo-1,4-beta-galactosidase